MKVVTHSRPQTIKQKKQSIINSQTSNSFVFQTPRKAFQIETPIKQQESQVPLSVRHNKVSAIHVTLSEQKSQRSLKLATQTEPGGNKLRRIRSIKQLECLHQTLSVSKSRYKFKADDSLSSSAKISNPVKKHFNDRIPLNILAMEGSIYSRGKDSSKQKTTNYKFSQSKVIKSLIMQNRQGE